jgi:hypothetical protein
LASLMAEIATDAADAPSLAALAGDCAQIGEWMLKDASLDDRLAGSVPFSTMCAVAVAGWQLLRQARAAAGAEVPMAIRRSKPVVTRYFLDHIVPEAGGLKAAATAGAALLYELDAEALTG